MPAPVFCNHVILSNQSSLEKLHLHPHLSSSSHDHRFQHPLIHLPLSIKIPSSASATFVPLTEAIPFPNKNPRL